MLNKKEFNSAENELYPDLEIVASLLQNLPGMVYRCRFDTAYTLLFASQGAVFVTGYTPQQLTASHGDLIWSEDREAVYREVMQAVQEERPYRCIYRIHTATGHAKWVLDRGRAVSSVDDTAIYLEGYVTDHEEQMVTVRQLEQKVVDRTRKLSALYDVLEVAADPSDLQTTITRTLHRVLKAINGNVGAIHLVDKTAEMLQLAAQQGLSDAVIERINRIDIEHHPLIGWIVRHNEPLLIPNMPEDLRTADFAGDDALNVFIGVPIVAREQVRGVLTVLSEDISRFTAAEEMELLVSVGEQIGVVVENARLRRQAEQLMVLEERNRLARELHDSVTQSLYSVTLFAEAGRTLTQSGELSRACNYFTDILETGQQALKEMRLLVHKLRPSLLDQEGLLRALQHRLNAVEGRAGVKNQLIIEDKLDLSTEMEECLFYICQEALNNAIKHAAAAEVRVCLQQHEDGAVVLQVIDNGNGFDTTVMQASGGLGLTSMHERAELLGGQVSIHSVIGKGTTVTVHLPANRDQA